jgi:hypothetical protein
VSNVRARKGVEGSEVIVDPPPVKVDRNGVSTVDLELDREKSLSARDFEDGHGAREKYVKRKGQGRRKARGGIGGDEEGGGKDVKEGRARGDMKRGKRRGEKNQDSNSLDKAFEKLHLSPTSPQLQNATAKPESPSDRKMRIRIITTDSLTAARMLTSPSTSPSPSSKFSSSSSTSNKKKPLTANPCILNMASSLRPGGGVLSGATSQEEFLCSRTTLLPSLRESFYRLPEIGGVFTRDVLVFRDARPLGDGRGELGSGDGEGGRYWVDVVSAGMLRFPELEEGAEDGGKDDGEGDGEEAVKRLSKKDRELVEAKMRAVLRIAQAKSVRKLVLGAWGCGAYGNPVWDIAGAWRTVLGGLGDEGVGRKKAKGRGDVETWHGLEDVVFAISSRKMAVEFAKAFGGHIQVEAGPGQDVDGEDEDEDGEDKVVQELRSKIQEMEGQIAQVWNADLKARMNVILQGLREQLSERGAAAEGSDDHEDQDEEEEEDLDEGGDDDGSRIDDFAGDEEIDDNGTDREGIGSDEGTDGFEVVDYDEALETSSTEGGLGLRR